MPSDDQVKHPGEEPYYNQGPQGEKLDYPPPKKRNIWKIATIFMSIVAVGSVLTAVVAFNLPRTTQVAVPTSNVTQVMQQSTTGPAPTSDSTPSSIPTVQPSATVADGVIQENITLTCGGCNDPIRVTINTVQIDSANGRMIWDNTLKDVTSSGNGFGFNEYNLQASTSQTPVQGTLSHPQSSGSNQEDIQAIFAFVPFHNVTYTLSVIEGIS